MTPRAIIFRLLGSIFGIWIGLVIVGCLDDSPSWFVATGQITGEIATGQQLQQTTDDAVRPGQQLQQTTGDAARPGQQLQQTPGDAVRPGQQQLQQTTFQKVLQTGKQLLQTTGREYLTLRKPNNGDVTLLTVFPETWIVGKAKWENDRLLITDGRLCNVNKPDNPTVQPLFSFHKGNSGIDWYREETIGKPATGVWLFQTVSPEDHVLKWYRYLVLSNPVDWNPYMAEWKREYFFTQRSQSAYRSGTRTDDGNIINAAAPDGHPVSAEVKLWDFFVHKSKDTVQGFKYTPDDGNIINVAAPDGHPVWEIFWNP